MSTTTEHKGRLEIINWRRHGDDESYCSMAVFGNDDTCSLRALIEAEHGVRMDAEEQGDLDAAYYVNDEFIMLDGAYIEAEDGKNFCISITRIKKLEDE